MSDCTTITILLDKGIRSIEYCWEDGAIEPGWSAKNVKMGLRKSFRTCQYFLKGLSPVCTHWKDTGCGYKQNDNFESPSGYNSGSCDFLGRRHWCDKYSPSSDLVAEEEKSFCIAPNPYLSGLGKAIDGYPGLRFAIPKGEITGYNEGNCDCYGMGRGSGGCSIGSAAEGKQSPKTEEELNKLPIVCNYYRPFSMGFGARAPHEVRHVDGSVDIKTRDDPMGYRLPLSFHVYNYRAHAQKCLWYDKDTGSNFVINGSTITIEDGGAPAYCKCTDNAADPFRTLNSSQPYTNFNGIWASGNTIICNGAKPECPKYSGKWVYCTDDRMTAGMPISAQQIFELRFWSGAWESQEQYDQAFQEKPNPSDKPTAAIFTFDRWKGSVTKAEDNVLMGYKVEMCQPAPLQNRFFDPNLYLKQTPVNFTDAFANKGTTSSNAPLFPSLVRIPDLTIVYQLEVTYPYASDESLSAEVCSPQIDPSTLKTTKRTNNLYEDYIHVVGNTLRNRTIYVINSSGEDVPSAPSALMSSRSIIGVPKDNRQTVFESITDYIDTVVESNIDYAVRTTSGDFGFFISNPVKLIPGENKLLIFVNFGDGTWDFAKRTVVSKFYGGLVVQDSFSYLPYEESLEEGYMYSYSDPKPLGKATAKIIPLGANVSLHSVIPVNRIEFNEETTYNYAIVERTVEDAKPYKWIAIGKSEYVWAVIEDKELNYVFPREVTGAKIRGTDKVTGKETEIELEEYTDVYTYYLPPDVFILKIKDTSQNRVVFNNRDWEITLSYKYQKFVSKDQLNRSKDVIIFPTEGDVSDIKSNLSYTPTSLTFNAVHQTTMSFVTFFADEEGRVISSFASKLLYPMTGAFCRSVEMFYHYYANAFQYTLVPETGRCINVKGAARTGRTASHSMRGECGDHELGYTGLGPMFFPFVECQTYAKYDIPPPPSPPFYPATNFCSPCSSAVNGPKNTSLDGKVSSKAPFGVFHRLDYRYRMPDLYKSWSELRVYSLEMMKPGYCYCTHYYTDCSMSAVVFSGWGHKASRIDRNRFIHYCWKLPTFGNKGREMYERFLSQDCIYHEVLFKKECPFYMIPAEFEEMYESQNGIDDPRHEWMPMAMDHTVFYFSFNVFDANSSSRDLVSENLYGFSFINQMNLLRSLDIAETLSETRYLFNDIFDINFEEKCTYPLPITTQNDKEGVIFYNFKSEDTAWAWQEMWYPIERGQNGTKRLNFLQLGRPNYIYDFTKKEHTLICEEGTHQIHFKAPNADDKKNAQISLDGVHYRDFEVVYGTTSTGKWYYDSSYYKSEQVDWIDIGGGGQMGGSSTQNNIYEKTSNENLWVHPKNMLFSKDASDSPASTRTITGASDNKQYYNRGLIANIKKDLLEFLPMKRSKCVLNSAGDGVYNLSGDGVSVKLSGTPIYTNSSSVYSTFPSKFVFYSSSVVLASEELNPKGNISGIHIEGIYGDFFAQNAVTGKTNKLVLVRPGVSITANTEDGDTYTLRGFSGASSLPSKLKTHERGTSTHIERYKIKILLPLSPIEMLKKRIVSFTITLTGMPGTYIFADTFNVEFAKYIDAAESITVWERKYKRSTFSAPNDINLDGPKKILHADVDLSNAGQYFSFDQLYKNNEMYLYNKIRGTAFGKFYDKKESFPISLDTLHEQEREVQKELYEDTIYSDVLSNLRYTFMLDPSILDFLSYNGIQIPTSSQAVFDLKKIPWDYLTPVKSFVQFPLWRVGGHKFVWSAGYEDEGRYHTYYGENLHLH